MQSNNSLDENLITFYLVPKDPKNRIDDEIQVLSSEYVSSTFVNSTSIKIGENAQVVGQKDQLNQNEAGQKDQDEYYNVTVNFLVKKGAT